MTLEEERELRESMQRVRGTPSLAGVLRAGKDTAVGTARQVAANLGDLSHLVDQTPQGMVAKKLRETVFPPEKRPEGTSVGPRGFAEHSTNPGVQALGMVADPTNLIGTPLAKGAALAAVPLARIIGKEAAPKAAKVTQEALATQLRALDARIAARRADLMQSDLMKAQRDAGEQGLQNMLREQERLRVQHDSMYDPMMRDAPRYDPGSQQQLIPGVEPLTAEQVQGRAQDAYRNALRGMTFEDMNRGLRFEYDPDWTGSALGSSQRQPGAWDVNYNEKRFTSPEGETLYRRLGKRPTANIRGNRIFRRELEDEAGTMVPAFDSPHVSPNTPQAQVGTENVQQMLARLEALRSTEREAVQRGEEVALTRAREMNERIRRNRAQLAQPGINADQTRQLQEEILTAKRNRPVEVDDERQRMAVPYPGEGLFSPIQWRDLLGHPVSQPDSTLIPLGQQTNIVRALRGEPPVRAPRAPDRYQTRLNEVEGRDPNAMNREAVDAFLTGARGNKNLFLYGLEPPKNVRSLDDFAEHFSEQSGEPIRVDWTQTAGDSDVPYKIEKTHGRGEVMRDRYGDYKYETADPGDKLRDEYGDVKKIEVEVPGPLPKDQQGELLTVEKPKRAEGGEFNYDEEGNPIYRKSRGGEPMRDERGNIKEQKNPDFYEQAEHDEASISGPTGSIDVTYADPAYITATGASRSGTDVQKRGGGGQLLYQTALAHAARNNIEIGGGSLTDINKYRLLSNVLSNTARMGKNTRDLAGTASGRAARARGAAEGPEIWRAEAEEGRERLLDAGVDPDRVKFDPAKGFSIDGKPASADDIKLNLGELSPNAGRHDETGGVGQKSLMRNAVFEWLRNASPADAARAAEEWPEAFGALFSKKEQDADEQVMVA